MSNLFWLSNAQITRLRPFFPKSHGKPRVDDPRALAQIYLPLAAAQLGRHGTRDHLHGPRASETTSLRRDHVDLVQFRIWVPRPKRRPSVEHPIEGDELQLTQNYPGHRDPRHIRHGCRKSHR
jgi:integrase